MTQGFLGFSFLLFKPYGGLRFVRAVKTCLLGFADAQIENVWGYPTNNRKVFLRFL